MTSVIRIGFLFVLLINAQLVIASPTELYFGLVRSDYLADDLGGFADEFGSDALFSTSDRHGHILIFSDVKSPLTPDPLHIFQVMAIGDGLLSFGTGNLNHKLVVVSTHQHDRRLMLGDLSIARSMYLNLLATAKTAQRLEVRLVTGSFGSAITLPLSLDQWLQFLPITKIERLRVHKNRMISLCRFLLAR